MNSPQDPRKEPLKDDELALARVLRALPGSEPSARVDSAILAAARDATSASPGRKHQRRGLPGWALGTAAAAVLAVGIGLQLPTVRQTEPDGLPAGAQSQAPVSSTSPAKREATESRLQEHADAEFEPAPPQAKPAPDLPRPLPSPQRQADPTPASAPPPAPPAPPAAPRALDRATPSEPAAAARSLPEQSRARESSAAADYAEAQALSNETLGSAAPAQEMVDRSEDLPSAFQSEQTLPPVDDDARLDADAWLERIRERIRQGDRAGAQASLHRFQRSHPTITLPPDLAAFRP